MTPKGYGRRLTADQKETLRVRLEAGASLREVARELGTSYETVRRVAKQHGWKRTLADPLEDGETGTIRLSTLGFREIRAPWHPNADPRGYVRLARYILSQQLGRPLYEWEWVRYLDGDILNDDPDNLVLETVITNRNRAAYFAWLQQEGGSNATGLPSQ